MPPKGSSKKRAGSVSAASFDDLSVQTAALTKSTAAVPIPEQGAAVKTHKVLSNKSGDPNKIIAGFEQHYVATSTYMSPKGKAFDATPPAWVVYWLMISATLMTWDAAFVLTRETYSDTWWHKLIWGAYHQTYSRVDKFYGDYGVTASPGYIAFAKSQTHINVVEVIGQWLAIVLSGSPIGSVIGLMVSVSTFMKTVLYMLMIGNSPNPQAILPSLALATPQQYWDFWVLFVGTNGWWILMPFLTIRSLTSRLIGATLHS